MSYIRVSRWYKTDTHEIKIKMQDQHEMENDECYTKQESIEYFARVPCKGVDINGDWEILS